jgi:hypothetical protein
MNPGADVRAVEAIEDWHNALCVFQNETSESLSAISLEIRRAYDWIDDAARKWKFEARDAEEEVVQAKVDLARRETPDYNGRIPDTSVQEENLARAKARLEHARDQIDVCRSWSQKLPKLVGEAYEVNSRQLNNFLDADLTRAISRLNSQITALHAYTAIAPVETKLHAPIPTEKPS